MRGREHRFVKSGGARGCWRQTPPPVPRTAGRGLWARARGRLAGKPPAAFDDCAPSQRGPHFPSCWSCTWAFHFTDGDSGPWTPTGLSPQSCRGRGPFGPVLPPEPPPPLANQHTAGRALVETQGRGGEGPALTGACQLGRQTASGGRDGGAEQLARLPGAQQAPADLTARWPLGKGRSPQGAVSADGGRPHPDAAGLGRPASHMVSPDAGCPQHPGARSPLPVRTRGAGVRVRL